MWTFRNLSLCRCGLALLAAVLIAGCAASTAEATSQNHRHHASYHQAKPGKAHKAKATAHQAKPAHKEKAHAAHPARSSKGYTVRGVTYYPLKSAHGYAEEGYAVWYGGKNHHGKATSSGETYNQHAMTAAHKTLPLGSHARVTCLRTGRSVVVRINDRGPFVKGYVIDLSYAAARQIGMLGHNRTRVRVEGLR
ncbi:MAG: septal ring lytic transglycosylase RlpA family protein [Desulfovibrionaceae bacterium]|nr:septal ring lytic transglycosylase RlpA family protein [Desulfovibrionaceae bacterium]MBR5734275.1 septal ring lytic transglycosylase RlpA family protein [Desulfovibrionaceae bacterium]